jgi:hypothetical protein
VLEVLLSSEIDKVALVLALAQLKNLKVFDFKQFPKKHCGSDYLGMKRNASSIKMRFSNISIRTMLFFYGWRPPIYYAILFSAVKGAILVILNKN